MKKCSFCGEEKPNNIINSGRDGAICDACLEIINREKKSPLNDQEISTNAGRGLWSPKELKKELDAAVIGQDKAKIQIIVEFYKRFNQNMPKNNIFLLGNSGVGKTYLIRSIASLLNVNYLEFDATTFSETGFKGREADEIVQEIANKTSGKKDELKRTIVFIDEIDKIVGSSNLNGTNKMQQSLLKIIEGSKFSIESGIGLSRSKKYTEVDTGEVMFVVAGACIGINDEEDGNRSIGFNSVNKAQDNVEVGSKELLNYGFIPEFVGRFPVIVQLEDLTRKDMKRILLESKDAVIPKYVELFEREGIDLVITDADIEELLDSTFNTELGVRGVQNHLVMELNTLLFEHLGEDKDRVFLSSQR